MKPEELGRLLNNALETGDEAAKAAVLRAIETLSAEVSPIAEATLGERRQNTAEYNNWRRKYHTLDEYCGRDPFGGFEQHLFDQDRARLDRLLQEPELAFLDLHTEHFRQQIESKLSDREKQLLAQYAHNPFPQSIGSVAGQCFVDPHAIAATMPRMVDKQFLTAEQNGRNKLYSVRDPHLQRYLVMRLNGRFAKHCREADAPFSQPTFVSDYIQQFANEQNAV